MIVIGFNWPIEHDHAVAIIQDGKLVFASEEERFTRHKHSPDEPPINALKQAFKFLKLQGIKPKDVDAYAVNYDPKLYPLSRRRLSYAGTFIRSAHLGISEGKSLLRYAAHYITGNYMDLAKGMIRKAIGDLNEDVPQDLRIYPVRHHLAHAASAYYFSGFNSAAVLTIDGYGEYEATVIWKVKDGNFEPILSMWSSYASLGLFYDFITNAIKLGHLEGPGKAMGLAPYGGQSKYYDKLKEHVKITPEGDKPYSILLNGKVIKTKSEPWRIYPELAELIVGNINWNTKGEINKDAADVAWAIQKVEEEAILATAKWAKDHTGEDKVALAGGVALNAKASMELLYSKMFNDIFIFPAANDAGSPIGAAAYVYEHILGGKMRNERLTHVYFGPEYSNDEVKKVIERSKFKAEYIGDDINAVAGLVAKGKIVTWYEGRAELGPRALGHRSILADPTRKDYWRLVNDIKGREWWRPLAPSLLWEDAGEYFKDPVKHEFMILMMRYKDKEAGNRVPVTCHVDFTARPQTVTGYEDKNWYNIIKAFKDLKGEGLVMNTSFNLAGEPIVETPQDAIKSFALAEFDAMYMQGWLIMKNS